MDKPKVLFFTKINFGNQQNAGYHSKVRAQAGALRKTGLDVDLLYFRNYECVIESEDSEKKYPFSNRLSLLWFMFITYPITSGAKHYQGLYIRHFLTNPLFLVMLLIYKLKKTSIVLELPTFPYAFEYKEWNKNRLLYLIDRCCSMFFRFFISRIVTFSFDDKIYGIKTIRTDNGVEVSKIKAAQILPDFNNEFSLLGLGNPRIWHAYERIIEGMKIFYQENPSIKVKFEIAGQGGELEKYRKLVDDYKLNKYVIFHGFQTGKNLDDLCERSHVAVASLGMHRINVAKGEASPLKAREFAARGIPFVTAYTDKGFPVGFPYILQFSADESPIDISKIVAFYRELRNTLPQYQTDLRQYAEDNLDWSAKMKTVADYFKQQTKIKNT